MNFIAAGAAVLLLSAGARAEQRTRRQALQIAREQALRMGVEARAIAPARRAAECADGEESAAPYYVFNNGGRRGWTIVSGDDRMPAVLGYSDEGRLDMDSLPEAVQDIFGSIERSYSRLDRSGSARNVSRRRTGMQTASAIGPLLTTKWDQYEPYSDLTPEIAGRHCATGCVAVALSQILYYLYHTQAGQDSTVFRNAIPAYTRDGYQVTDSKPAPRTYHWSRMLTDYAGKDYTGEQAEAVARLMVDVGCALQMKYGNGGTDEGSYFSSTTSSEYVQKYALNYFGLDASASYVSVPASMDAFFTMVDKELNTYHPVQVAGSGHAFVCDGRDSTGVFYHFNFGYDGRGNGFYSQDAYDGYDNTPHLTAGLRLLRTPATPTKAVDKLKVIYNSAFATAALEPVGYDTPGFYQPEYYLELQRLLKQAQAAINGETTLSDDEMVALGERVSEAEQRMTEYRTPYPSGTYYLKNFAEHDGRDVAMYANAGLARYGTLNTSLNIYKWQLTYDEERNAYTIKNMGSGTFLNSVSSSDVKLGRTRVYCEVWPTNRVETGSRYTNDCWGVNYTNTIRPITAGYRDNDDGYVVISPAEGKAGSASGKLIGWQPYNDWDVWVPVPISVEDGIDDINDDDNDNDNGNGNCYNLAGQRVSAGYRGIVVRGGKLRLVR